MTPNLKTGYPCQEIAEGCIIGRHLNSICRGGGGPTSTMVRDYHVQAQINPELGKAVFERALL